MRKLKGLALLTFVSIFALCFWCSSGYTLSFSIFVENKKDGMVKVEEGGKVIDCGRVLSPAYSFNKSPFTASRWGRENTVVATAVNAIHILGKDGLLSLLPKDAFSSGARSDSSILTDIPPQGSIFGGGYSPFVGSEVSFKLTNGIPEALEIRVVKEKDGLSEILFENWVGGRVLVSYISGRERIIGKVLKPVHGIGRFLGSEYTGVGRIRANHPGVICVSTSALGGIGGFQIIPYRHSLSPEMVKLAWGLTQWMVVDLDPGSYPLFFGALLPNWNPKAISEANWEELLLRRSLVMVKFEGDDDWRFLKDLRGRDDLALRGLKYVKIILPFIR